jgi:hypothetical protein
MSQLIIIKFGFAGEIAGANIPPPPEMPMGCQGVAWAGEVMGANALRRQSANESRFKSMARSDPHDGSTKRGGSEDTCAICLMA